MLMMEQGLMSRRRRALLRKCVSSFNASLTNDEIRKLKVPPTGLIGSIRQVLIAQAELSPSFFYDFGTVVLFSSYRSVSTATTKRFPPFFGLFISLNVI